MENLYYTPNGESPDIRFSDTPNMFLEAQGIENVLVSESFYFEENTLTIESYAVTLADCFRENCYYENIYFYDFLTDRNHEPKTFTYSYNERDGYKYLILRDEDNNRAIYSTEPSPVPNSMLFQTWYLYMSEVDLGDPVFYSGPNAPRITIDEDFSYTGMEDCAMISGDFILGNGGEYDFVLQSRNYIQDETNCPPGSFDYALWELQTDLPLYGTLYQEDENIDYLLLESYAGFIHHFINTSLSTPDNGISDFTIFPNPAKAVLNILWKKANIESILITDINGRSVIVSKDTSTRQIDVSALRPGLYFIHIESAEGNTTKKFIKE